MKQGPTRRRRSGPAVGQPDSTVLADSDFDGRQGKPALGTVVSPGSLAELISRVRQAAVEAGFDGGDYRLLRQGTNIVLANDRDGLVARVALADVPVADMAGHLKLLAGLASAGAPFVCPLAGPVSLGQGRLVTFWPLVETSEPASPETVAGLVARCHQLVPPAGLRRWTPQFYDRQVAVRLDRAVRAGAPKEAVDQLESAWRAASRQLASCWRDRAASQAEVVLHADPQPSNTGRVDGRWQLLDLDGVCAGPAETDLAQIISYASLGGQADRIPAIMAAYRLPVDDRLLETAVRVRRVKRVSWVAALWASRPDARPALLHMVATIDSPSPSWPVL